MLMTSAYMYFQDIDASATSIGAKSMQALGNALIVLGLVAGLTFAVVLLYKFDCMRFFLAYCILYSTLLLGAVGSKMVLLLVDSHLHWVIDSISLVFIMYNFTAVGVLSIFYQRGMPMQVEQGYLVIISVIVAWQLSQLPEWSSWMILLLLGFWDMFAVLTPMGPLRWLVDLIQEKGDSLPGLLFEAPISSAHESTQAPKARGLQPARSRSSEQALLHKLMSSSTQSVKHQSLQLLPPTHAMRLYHRLAVFLADYNSSFQDHAADLSTVYADRELALWRPLYQFYGVHSVAACKPYPSPDQVYSSEEDTSIRLGLGDFIFYSVLVAQASKHSMAAFATCFLAILLGLAITMQLLARFDALPALPISIFSGIAAFLVATQVLEPFLAHQHMIGF